MDEIIDQIRLFQLNEFNYPKFRFKILDLYLHAFTTGDYAQYIDLISNFYFFHYEEFACKNHRLAFR